jgi:DNA-binding HxlR family transcriptional regulator
VRSYGQYCALAKALDVIGDRWNLLIVRELLLRGPCRYTDLLHGLPGIATNLLADRLRELERAGVVAREEAPPPVASGLFKLTPRGEQLERVLVELGRWGVPLMAAGPAEQDAFRAHWLRMPVELFLRERVGADAAARIELDSGEERVTIDSSDGHVRLRPGPAADPDLVLHGDPYALLGVLSRRMSFEDARERGLHWQGELAALERLRVT